MAGPSVQNEQRMVNWSPISALKEAVKAVPAMKYALAVLGLVAVVATIAAWRVNFKVAVFGAVIILILMVAVLVFARLTAISAGFFLLPALILWYAFVLLTTATGVLLFHCGSIQMAARFARINFWSGAGHNCCRVGGKADPSNADCDAFSDSEPSEGMSQGLFLSSI